MAKDWVGGAVIFCICIICAGRGILPAWHHTENTKGTAPVRGKECMAYESNRDRSPY